jgi:hypothetical protein
MNPTAATRDTSDPPIRLAGRTLTHHRHICAFFNSREEQDKVLMPFFREGLERGEKVLNIVDARLHDEHLCACERHGIDATAAQASGQFEVLHWEDAYLKDGYFDGDRMVRVVEDIVQANRARFGLSRLMGNMEWALESAPGVTDIVEYETKLNYVLPKYPDPVVCVYDLNKHSGRVVMDILRTHPMVIIGGVLQENPLYVSPDELLGELRSRKEEPAEASA